jgi:lipoprotein NlpI
MPVYHLQSGRCFGLVLLGACAFLLPSSQGREKDKANELLLKAEELLAKAPEKALDLANQAIKLDPADAKLWYFRGTVQESLKHYAAAVADFDACLKLDPKLSNAYQERGVAHFQLGKVKESAADFDEYVKQKPERANGHWQRGISLYYAGRFEDGKKQFEGYEKVDTNDVENAIWHFLCNAQLVGIPKAREQMLKIGNDRRVPMRQIYELYRGRCKPEDVMAAA